VVTEWPGNSGVNNEFLEKVPSTIAYLKENENISQTYGIQGDVWGYEVKPALVSCSWTKLLLDRHARSTEYDDINLESSIESGLLRLPPGKTASSVTTDYLSKLYKHCMKILGRHYADLLESTPIEFWFTMPAMWSDKAQNATKMAARNAGFGSRPLDTISMITEPEAGVLAAINSPMSSIDGALEVNSKFCPLCLTSVNLR
jgi:molecular chaperone DnaK (HSP70)